MILNVFTENSVIWNKNAWWSYYSIKEKYYSLYFDRCPMFSILIGIQELHRHGWFQIICCLACNFLIKMSIWLKTQILYRNLNTRATKQLQSFKRKTVSHYTFHSITRKNPFSHKKLISKNIKIFQIIDTGVAWSLPQKREIQVRQETLEFQRAITQRMKFTASKLSKVRQG